MLTDISDLIQKGGVFYDIEGSTPIEIYKNVANLLNLPLTIDAKTVYDALCDRENFMSTAVGRGIALPHARTPVVKNYEDQRICVVFLKTPIKMKSPDVLKVYVMFIILSQNSKEHLDILASLGTLFRNDDFKKILENRPNKDTLIKAIRDYKNC